MSQKLRLSSKISIEKSISNNQISAWQLSLRLEVFEAGINISERFELHQGD
jgi:hypothetical protein